MRVKHFISVFLMIITLSLGKAWGALSSPSVCTFASSNSTTLSDNNTDVTWVASNAPSGFDNNSPYRGLQWGGAIVGGTDGITLSCSSYSGKTITQIAVVWSRNVSQGATVSAKVGGSDFGSADTKTNSPSNVTSTFTGSATGNISIKATSTATNKSFYIKSITVTYTEGSTCTKSVTITKATPENGSNI